MSFLRLGMHCVVKDEQGRVLLSQRGDLKTWNLPGGRLDKGERLIDGALREVREETGIEATITRIVGLYYITRWQRLNVLFEAKKVGGSLHTKTDETLDNRFFDLHELPQDLLHKRRIEAAMSGHSVLEIVDTSEEEYQRLRRKFAARWVSNLVQGRPEPRYPRFTVNAVGLFWDAGHFGVLNNGNQLPRVTCDGESAPWQQLADHFIPGSAFQWVGIHEDVNQGVIEFVFSTTVNEDATVTNIASGRGQSTRVVFKESPFSGRDAQFVKYTQPETRQPIWVSPQSS